jgi:hypothetical protein
MMDTTDQIKYHDRETVMQAIIPELEEQRRDALVAYYLGQIVPSSATSDEESANKTGRLCFLHTQPI